MADLRGARPSRPPGPNSFNFMQFLGKFGKIVCWHPPGELAPPLPGNPGSATDLVLILRSHFQGVIVLIENSVSSQFSVF